MSRIASPVRAGGWGLLVLLATAVGLFSLRYALRDPPLVPPDLRASLDLRPAVFVLHALAAAAALLLAPWQLLAGLRRRRPGLHRRMGRAYAGAVLIAGLAGFPLAAASFAGPVAAAGFAALALAWILSTALGVRAARAGDLAAHRRWMLRSVALTCAATTLRLYLPIPPALGWSFVDGYRVIAWACWLPNLLAVEAWLSLRQGRRSARSGAPVGVGG